VISAQLRLSGFYDKIAGSFASRLDHPGRFLLVLMMVTGFLSAFLNHDIVCFVFTPIVAVALLKKQYNPIPFLIALAISSNIGAAATLIGNPQDMMIGAVTHTDFAHYMLWSFPPVAFAMVSSFIVIWMMSRKQIRTQVAAVPQIAPRTYPYSPGHTYKGLGILIAVVALFFTPLPKEVIALAAAGIHLASPKFGTDDILDLVDWPLLILFMGLFVVTSAFQSTGYGDAAMHWLAGGGFDLNAPLNLTVATVALSNLLNNSAAVMLLLKVIDLTRPTAAYILALANSFGGSLFLIGSVANILVVQKARENGLTISFWDFAKLGVPTTLVAIAGLVGWVYIIQ
jgi:Na+/H+ antiporter NhaD/arsenite permease-like protein